MARRAGDDAFPAAGRGPVLGLWLLVALGLALRLGNAATATIHDDELHYAADAGWAGAGLGLAGTLRFLRDHPGDHRRLDPRTGMLAPWGARAGEIARLGHPCLVQYVGGVVAWLVGPATSAAAVKTGRVLNAILDSATIVLLPRLVVALGEGAGAGLLAAGLYAVFPPAVTYGSLDYLDPALSPLLVLLLLTLLDPHPGAGRWLRAGVQTGLLLATKQVGLIALVLVPAATVLLRRWSGRGLALWAVTGACVLTLFTSPAAYLAVLLRPSRPVGQLHLTPLAFLAGNLGYWLDPARYYWLSFARHGAPLAPLVARVHPILTPAYLTVYLLAGARALAGGAGRRLLALYLPAFLLLGFTLPSDGLWRFHLLSPLVCAAVAIEVAAGGRVWRVVALGAALGAATIALWPQRPGADGRLDLGDLLFMNPAVRQRPHFHGPDYPLVMIVGAGVEVSRRVWLPPGKYAVEVASSAPAALVIDSRMVENGGATPAEVTLAGYVHRVALSFPGGGVLQALALRRRGP